MHEPVQGNMKMRYLHSIANWTAALCAASGVACIFAYMSVTGSRTYALIAAEAAATIGVVSLLVSVLTVYLLMRRQSAVISVPGRASGERWHSESTARDRARREVLSGRLDIDEPQVCSQYMITCTCWSFCAGSDGETPPCVEPLSAAKKAVPMRNLLSKVNGLPVVRRNGKDSCPFRFTSPFARLGRADGDGSNAAEGTSRKA